METPSLADLRASALFDGIDDSALEGITDWFEKRTVDVGEVLAREGASGYAFMLLGTATATVAHGEQVVRELGPGDWFGEGAILGSGRRTATVTAASAGTVWVLFGTRFRELGQRFPEQQALIEQVFASRQD
jgi:CRP-like cAMP-binding protein